MPKKTLFDDEGNSDDNDKLVVNKSYAKNYEIWRRKEDYQKLKDKYGEDALESNESDDSESTDEDGLAEPDNPDFDMDFFRVLAAIRQNHPILKEKDKFFKDSYSPKSTKGNKQHSNDDKPLTVSEYERKRILEQGGKYEDDETPSSSQDVSSQPNQRVIFDDNLSEDDADDLFIKKEKEKTQQEEEENEAEPENEAIEFLKGKKSTLKNDVDSELLEGLRKDWKANMSTEDKYLMDYFVNQRYLEEEDDAVERAPNHYAIDIEPLEDDEETFNRMEEYETKYRFRFEEPDQDFIRRYPRVIGHVVREKDTKRKDQREKKKTTIKEKEEKKNQELKRMRAWKKKEVLDKIHRLEAVAGRSQIGFQDMDLDSDFDPSKHDEAMSKMFDDDYYNEASFSSKEKPKLDDPELEEELKEEYEKLDRLDDLSEGTFKYADVYPSSFGLTTEQIMYAKDSELNRWYSMKKVLKVGRSEEAERRDDSNFAHRATLETTVRRILPSIYADDLEEQWAKEEERKRTKNLKKKERKLRKQKELVETNEEEIKKQNVEDTAADASQNTSNASMETSNSKEEIVDSINPDTSSNAKKKKRKRKKKSNLLTQSDMTETLQTESDMAEVNVDNSAENPSQFNTFTSELVNPRKKKKRGNNDDTSIPPSQEIYTQGKSSRKKKMSQSLNTKSKHIAEGEPVSQSTQTQYKKENSEYTKLRKKKEPKIKNKGVKRKIIEDGIDNKKRKKYNRENEVADNEFMNRNKKKNFKHSTKFHKNPEKINEDNPLLKGISDDRLRAYGANPKKLKKSLKYAAKTK